MEALKPAKDLLGSVSGVGVTPTHKAAHGETIDSTQTCTMHLLDRCKVGLSRDEKVSQTLELLTTEWET